MRAKPPTKQQFIDRVARFRAIGATDLQVAVMTQGVALTYMIGGHQRYSYLYHNFLYGHNPEGRALDREIRNQKCSKYGQWLKEITP